MKNCPFCAEEIQDGAVKCRFCGEFLDAHSKPKAKWYFTTPAVVIAMVCVGPLALSLVWLNPHYKIITKVVVTGLVIALTFLLGYFAIRMYSRFLGSISEMGIR
jgi:hypothetical protein